MIEKPLQTLIQKIPPELPKRLLRWYDANRRELPWREDPHPYAVWVSEIMLQQTRVEAVKPYFLRFMAAFPTIRALAEADETSLLKMWEGLGYYSRARNLQKAAKMIVAQYGGDMPSEYIELLKLTGIGDYTAGAVASIAFGKAVPAVDGNVLRVISRVLGSHENISLPEGKKNLREKIVSILPEDRPGDFNQALMELGAIVCVPNGAPKCEQCPLAELCLAKKDGTQGHIPVKSAKKERRIELRTVFLFIRNGKVALRKREDTGLLAKLWEFPNTITGEEDVSLAAWGMPDEKQEPFGSAKHIFTHVEWHMKGILIEPLNGTLPDGWVWADRANLTDHYPIPNAFKAFSAKLLRGHWIE